MEAVENATLIAPPRKKPGRPKFDVDHAGLREIEKRLTPKQYAYANALATGGMPKIQAYRRAYNVKPGRPRNSVQRDACTVSAKPIVSRAVELMREANSRPELRDAASTRSFVLEVLRREAQGEGPDTNATARISAATWLGKSSHVGLFVDRKEIVHRQGPAATPDLELEILQRFAALAGAVVAPAVDIAPVPLELPADDSSDNT